jgi:hypothetical protein
MPGHVHGAADAFVAGSIAQWNGRSDLLNSVLGGGLSSGNYGTYQPDVRIYPNKRNKDTNGRDKDRKNGDLPYTRLYWEVEHGNRDSVAIRQRGQRYMACPYTSFFSLARYLMCLMVRSAPELFCGEIPIQMIM